MSSMRVSTAMIYDTGVATMQQQTANLLKLQEQLSTQQSILTPSDNPVAAAQALQVTQANNINTQYATNQNYADDALGLSESTLDSAGTLLQSMYQSLVHLGNGSLTDQDRQSIATSLTAGFNQLMGYANQQDGLGNYLFAGYRGDTQPFTGSITNGVTYQGDDGVRTLAVSPTRNIQTSDSGSNIFMSIPDTSVPFQANATSTNTGDAVMYGQTITNPAAWSATSNTQTYNVSFDNPSTATAPALSYTITDYQGNTVNTGTYTPAVVTLPDATTMNLKGTPNLGDSYLSANGQYKVVFDDPSSAPAGSYSYTIFDATTGDPEAGFQNLSYTPASIALPNGAQVNMAGTPAPGDSFAIRPSGTVSVFSVLSSIVAATQQPYATADTQTKNAYNQQLASAISDVQSAMDNILTYRASIGARQQELTSLQSANTTRGISYQSTLDRLQNVDMAKTISDFTQTQVSLQAAQLSFTKITSLSLFNYLSS